MSEEATAKTSLSPLPLPCVQGTEPEWTWSGKRPARPAVSPSAGPVGWALRAQRSPHCRVAVRLAERRLACWRWTPQIGVGFAQGSFFTRKDTKDPNSLFRFPSGVVLLM